MTGSRRWFRYLSDSNLEYAVQLDETKAEIGALGFATITGGSAGPVADGRVLAVSGRLPLSMRYVNAQRVDADGRTIRRRFQVGTLFAFNALRSTNTITGEGGSWAITSYVGERSVGVPLTDTGLIDGDVDDNFTAAP